MHVFLFDIDGTLVSTGGAGKSAMEAALVSAFGAEGGSGSVPYSGRTDRAIGRDLFRLHGISETPENWQRFITDYLGHLPASLKSHPGRVLPGIADLLVRLHGRELVHLGLLTGNIREGARLKLNHFDLYRYFAFGGFGDNHWQRDDVARFALEQTRDHVGDSLHPERLWVIGDTPLDVQCGRAIGARVAAVATGWHPLAELEASAPDLLFSDFSDATPLLRACGFE